MSVRRSWLSYETIGLVAGAAYVFSQDMKILSGNSTFTAIIPKGLANYTAYLQVATTTLSNALATHFVK